MEISRVGVDLAKNVFQLHGADDKGETVWKRKLSRDKWLKVLFTEVKPGTEVGMEACAGAHHWARALHAAGYRVKMIPPQFVKPFVKSNKNDANDAQAICEAMARPNMYPVSIKTVEQQDIQAMHRVREEIKNPSYCQSQPDAWIGRRIWVSGAEGISLITPCCSAVAGGW
jgi:transposase